MLPRWLGAALALPSLVVVGLLAGSFLASGSGSRAVTVWGRAADRTSGPEPIGDRPTRSAPVAEGIVANVREREASVYRAPDAPRPWRRYSNPTARKTPLVFLVRVHKGAWLRVMLPSRPNGSEGWVRAADVELRANPYSVSVDLKARKLVVHDAHRVALSTAVGVGRGTTPTPSGLYYVTELLRQPNPHGVYGPWAFALSAYSPVLTHFGAGNGQVGLHGTDDPAGLGHTVSHGCIRVRNSVIRRLAAMLPLGTPVRIVSRAHKFTGV